MSAESHLPADWPAPANIRAFTTLRSGPGISLNPFHRFNLGSRCGDDPEHVRSNRDRLVSEFGLPAAPRWLQQVHGVQVARFDWTAGDVSATSAAVDEPIADAAVTSLSDTAIAVLTADCLPVFFCSAAGAEIAVAHAGWRGLADGILEATVRAMRAPPESLLVWLGPAAGSQAYEIGVEVRDAFLAHDQRATMAFAATREGHWLVDLYALARQRLSAIGVERVYGGGLCTISDPTRFYSHRRDQRTGRMASVIVRA
jgi:YfiH family protein